MGSMNAVGNDMAAARRMAAAAAEAAAAASMTRSANRIDTTRPAQPEEVKGNNPLLSLAETTIDGLRTPDLVTEDRICNKEELDGLNIFSYAFCIIC